VQLDPHLQPPFSPSAASNPSICPFTGATPRIIVWVVAVFSSAKVGFLLQHPQPLQPHPLPHLQPEEQAPQEDIFFFPFLLSKTETRRYLSNA